jgi:hypothetical protein
MEGVMSDYMSGLREARLNMWHRKQQEEFKKNAFRRQKMYGIIICGLAIISQAFVNSIFWGIEVLPIMAGGIYMICTERRYV